MTSPPPRDPRNDGSDNEELRRIQAALEGDQEAFRQIFEEKKEKVYWAAYQVLGDAEDARDVTQRVFVKIWRNLHRYRRDHKFDTWLYRITRNAAIDTWRKRKARGPRDPLPDEGEGHRQPEALSRQPGQADSSQMSEIQGIFDVLAQDLTEKQRQAFTLRELQGLTTREVARVMRTTQSTVRNHVFQARKVLQEGLRRHYPEYMPRSLDPGDSEEG